MDDDGGGRSTLEEAKHIYKNISRNQSTVHGGGGAQNNHFQGGVILPNKSIGNNIGAFVSRFPSEMNHNVVGGGCFPPTE